MISDFYLELCPLIIYFEKMDPFPTFKKKIHVDQYFNYVSFCLLYTEGCFEK